MAAGRSVKGTPGHCQSVPKVAFTEFMVYDWSLLRSALKYVVKTAEDAYVKRTVVRALAHSAATPAALLLSQTGSAGFQHLHDAHQPHRHSPSV